MRLSAFAAAGLMMAFVAASASAETISLKATLSPQSEVPPHPALKGSGTLQGSFDTSSRKLTYTVTYDGLTGPATMAHFHGPAPIGKNAGVMVPITGALTSPINGSATLTEDQAKSLEAGDVYFNIHTAENKGGEIRGQVEKGE